MVQGKPNNRAQAPVLLASGLNEANSITGSLLPDNCVTVSHIIKGCDEVWLFGMKDPCVYIDAEPNFLAQMRIFHSGTVCAIAAHASEAARVLRGKYGPGLALQQVQAYIGDYSDSKGLPPDLFRHTVVNKPCALYTPPGIILGIRVLNATMPVGLRVSFLPALMHCSVSQSNYRTLLELVNASPPNPLLDAFV